MANRIDNRVGGTYVIEKQTDKHLNSLKFKINFLSFVKMEFY